MITYDFVFLT